MTSPQTLTISGVPAAEVVAILGAAGVPFAEVAAEQVSLERAYLDLTSDAVEYTARPAAAPPGPGAEPAFDGAQAKDAVR